MNAQNRFPFANDGINHVNCHCLSILTLFNSFFTDSKSMLAEHRACLRERLWSCYSDEAPQTKNVHSLQSKSSKNKRYKFREMEKLATFPTLSASVTVWLLPCRLKSSIELVCAVSVVCRSSVLTLPLFADRGEQAGAGQQVNADNHHEPAECPGRRPPPAARVPRRSHHVSTPPPPAGAPRQPPEYRDVPIT